MLSGLREEILHGDCLDKLKEMPDNSVDSCVTDPPYGLSKEPVIDEVLSKWLAGEAYDHGHGGFMGKEWDSFVPHPDIWREVYRVLKPGGHALVFAGTRTQDLMTISLRMAGFEVRDSIAFLFFSGFPKSHDVGKAFDRRAGAEREVLATVEAGSAPLKRGHVSKGGGGGLSIGTERSPEYKITAPATELARKWDGWGTALKPAHEPIIVVRKPLIDADTGRKLTVADCVEKYGTGAINIDASRIATEDTLNYSTSTVKGVTPFSTGTTTQHSQGRFPANCITLDSDAFYSKYFNVTPAELSKKASKKDRNSDWKGEEIDLVAKRQRVAIGNRTCVNCGKSELDGRRSGACCDVPSFENKQVKAVKNSHPTVKPTDLMAWLVRLVTPPNGTVLDPFAGSGSTLVAAKREGFGFIGIEREAEYVEIIEARTGTKVESEKEAIN